MRDDPLTKGTVTRGPADRLPETPLVAWSQHRTPWWSPMAWLGSEGVSRWFGGGGSGPGDRRGVVELSVNGLTVIEHPAAHRQGATRFVSWSDVISIDPVGTASMVAVINRRFEAGPPIVLDERHIPPGKRGPEISARRAAVLERAWELAQAQSL